MKMFKGDADERWSRIITASGSASMQLLLSQSCRLRAIHQDGRLFWKSYRVEIETSSIRIGMIQSRKNLLEEACQRELDTKKVTVFLIAV
tara:strand:+ start:330 stop:599 length:270 start_codon:yes stop_codon:yes gene_type:complete